MNATTIPADAIWELVAGAILLLIGIRGKGYVRFGGLGAGRRFYIGGSKLGRGTAATLGGLLIVVAILEFLGLEKRLGITAIKHLATTAATGDVVLILVGASFLIAAFSARSYTREAGELLQTVPQERVLLWIRILCSGVSIICLSAGVWGLTHL